MTDGDAEIPSRAFKTAVFARLACEARIDDAALCEALREVMLGPVDAKINHARRG
ncbi:type II toxin-antitoxin system RelE/ParE family toxin [Methylobacterium sp. Leaf118]|uniref:type II toxin-antitoxin system RelE/ParE family toxin n=1 Tax=Methylobacterium sp. Leaf118 TaxID=2876562 RepID=UPI001E2991B1|nr:type II toxin-antitoxin system RelE/ParE family toxin [Methylobacterium sp. Leaf118]